MPQRILNWCFLAVGFATLSGCDWMPGRPKEEDRWKPPEEIKNFADLYDTNCLACHGSDKILGPSISMHNPIYLSVVPKEAIRKVIAEGVPGTMMPGFSAAVGGMLTDEQINILTDGIHDGSKGPATAESKGQPTTEAKGAATPEAKGPATTEASGPPYAAAAGDAQRGATVYEQACAQCHGKEGAGGEKAGSVVDAAYLSLVSDQYLRTVVIAGRPELGMPGYKEYVAGKPMTAEEIADVVGWLASHRQGPAPGSSTTPPATAANAETSPSKQQ
jgi:cytochrome c oxidase cbb3-type subunit 3